MSNPTLTATRNRGTGSPSPSMDLHELSTALSRMFSPDELFTLISSLIGFLLTPTTQGEMLDRRLIYANRLAEVITAREFLIAEKHMQLSGQETLSPEDRAASLKQWLTKTHGVPIPRANSLSAAVAVMDLMDVEELISDGTLPLHVLMTAAKSTENHLKDDLPEGTARQVFADVARQLKLKTASCSAQGRQVTKTQARWVVKQVLEVHPEKTKPAEERRKGAQRTVHIGLTLNGEMVPSQQGQKGKVLECPALSRKNGAWTLDDATVCEMQEKGVTLRISIVTQIARNRAEGGRAEPKQAAGESGQTSDLQSIHAGTGIHRGTGIHKSTAHEKSRVRHTQIRLNRKQRRQLLREASRA